MSSELWAAPKQAWAWPDSLDALEAAPGNHSLLFENEPVRVMQTRILPGGATPVHTHRWPSVMYVFAWSDLLRSDDLGNVLMDTRQSAEIPALNLPVAGAVAASFGEKCGRCGVSCATGGNQG